MSIDIEGIRRALPHRYPFLLIDRVLERDDDRVVALKNVSANEPFFQGHFREPLGSVMPGVLIVEAMAQTAAFLVLDPNTDSPQSGYLVGIDKARFRRKVVPGDQLRLEVRAVRRRRELLQADATASVDGETAATATLSIVRA
jgi:3-hydroxyacyl-[acyl-carrier-protein] dehydratase